MVVLLSGTGFAVQLVCVYTIAVMRNVTAADGRRIPMTTLSHLEGGRSEW